MGVEMNNQLFSASGLALACSAALGLLLFGLSVAISAVRLKRMNLLGTNGDPEDLLTKLVRAHGNTAEYSPLLALFMLTLAATGHPGPFVSAMMVLATVSRFLFALGMLISPTLARPNLIRAAGASGTYIAGFALSLAMLAAVG